MNYVNTLVFCIRSHHSILLLTFISGFFIDITFTNLLRWSASPPTEKKSKKTKEEASVAETPKRPISELYDMNGRELSDVVRELCARYPEINWLTSKTNETPEGLILKSV